MSKSKSQSDKRKNIAIDDEWDEQNDKNSGKFELLTNLIKKIKSRKDMSKTAASFAKIMNEKGSSLFYIEELFKYSVEKSFAKTLMKFMPPFLKNLEKIDSMILPFLVANFQLIEEHSIFEYFFMKIESSEIVPCLNAMKKKLNLEMLQHVVNGIKKHGNENISKELFLNKDNLIKIIGIRLLKIERNCEDDLGKEIKNTKFDAEILQEILQSISEDVLNEGLSLFEDSEITNEMNEQLFSTLFKRGKLDSIGKKLLNIINLKNVDDAFLDKLFSMFFIDPQAFLPILDKLKDRGYQLNEIMVKELIEILPTIYDDRRKTIGTHIFSSVTFKHLPQLIQSLRKDNVNSQLIILDLIEKIVPEMDAMIFLEVCTMLANGCNRNLEFKIMKMIEKNIKPEFVNLIESWKKKEKLRKLLLWVYPLNMADKGFYKNLYEKMKSEGECESVDLYYSMKKGLV